MAKENLAVVTERPGINEAVEIFFLLRRRLSHEAKKFLDDVKILRDF